MGRARLPSKPRGAVPVAVPAAAPAAVPAPRAPRSGRIALRTDVRALAVSGHAPRAVTADVWSRVPEHQRAEVLERAAYFNIRDRLPDDAVRTALEHVAADEAEAEGDFDWDVARAIVSAFPAPSRDVDHRPSPDMLRMAVVVERLVAAEIERPGTADDAPAYFDGFGLGPEVTAALAGAFSARLARVRAESGVDAAPPEPLPAGSEHDLPAPVRGLLWVPEDEYGGFGI